MGEQTHGMRGVLYYYAAIIFILGFSAGAITERLGWLTDHEALQAQFVRERLVVVSAGVHEAAITEDALHFGEGPIQVTTFTDYECPYCTQWDSIAAHSADLTVRYRNFPLRIHPTARRKHKLVECVRRLEGNEAALRAARLAFTLPKTADWAIDDALRLLGLEASFGEIETCVVGPGADHDFVEVLLRKDSLSGVLLGITSTPAHVVDTLLFSGAFPVPILRKALGK